MKFKDMEYARPDMDGMVKELEGLTEMAKKSTTGDELVKVYEKLEGISNEFYSQLSISYVRHTIDTNDEFYDKENDFYDNNSPVFSSKGIELYQAILNSPHKGALAARYGQILLDKIEYSVKGSDKRTLSLQQEENALSSRYDKIYASAKIPFRGEVLTVSQLMPYKVSKDRALRKEALEAEGTFFDTCREEFDEIFDKLVKNRHEQAQILGYENYCPLSDIRMERLGYGRKEVGLCRDAVLKGIVPVVEKLKKRQAERIGVSDFKFYDDLLSFKDGNPTPKGSPEEILAAGQVMYRGLSAETGEFIDFMMDGDLFDVLSRPGKSPGGYCTTISKYKAPFIFSNFNGTAGDVDVLTHEAGHAFAAHRAMAKNLPMELISPGLESCEIHSMSMEFLTAGYHEMFFKEDSEKYSLYQPSDAMYFLPYGCMVDEFQENIYSRPGLSPGERNELWAELEKKYRPWIDFDDIPFYSRGAGWQRQTHIFQRPFYYIDYVLAQSVALEFFVANKKDGRDAWQRYLALVEKAGTETYGGLVHAAGFKTPYEEGTMEQVGKEVLAFIESHPLY